MWYAVCIQKIWASLSCHVTFKCETNRFLYSISMFKTNSKHKPQPNQNQIKTKLKIENKWKQKLKPNQNQWTYTKQTICNTKIKFKKKLNPKPKPKTNKNDKNNIKFYQKLKFKWNQALTELVNLILPSRSVEFLI